MARHLTRPARSFPCFKGKINGRLEQRNYATVQQCNLAPIQPCDLVSVQLCNHAATCCKQPPSLHQQPLSAAPIRKRPLSTGNPPAYTM